MIMRQFSSFIFSSHFVAGVFGPTIPLSLSLSGPEERGGRDQGQQREERGLGEAPRLLHIGRIELRVLADGVKLPVLFEGLPVLGAGAAVGLRATAVGRLELRPLTAPLLLVLALHAALLRIEPAVLGRALRKRRHHHGHGERNEENPRHGHLAQKKDEARVISERGLYFRTIL